MKPSQLSIISASLLLVASCSDDKSSPVASIGEKTYTDASGLQLFYNGEQMPGKTVAFNQSGNNATITAYSEFDLAQLSMPGISGKIPAPGVIPGSSRLEIAADLVNTGESWEFSGNGDNGFCSYSYSGYATPGGMKLFINDPRLKMAVEPAAWIPAPIKKNESGMPESLPFYIDWQYDPVEGIDLDLNPVLQALVTLPVIPVYDNTAYMSVSQAFTEVMRTIAFRPDGNIIFTYVNDSFGAAQIAQTAPNGYQYVITSPSEVKLFVNPISFFGLLMTNTSGGTPASEIDLNAHGLFPAKKSATAPSASSIPDELREQLLAGALQAILPQLATGLPFSFSSDGKSMQIFLDTKQSVDLLTKILAPILKDDAIIKNLVEYISSNPTLSPLLPDIRKALSAIPSALEQTTVFRLGFNLLPYTGK